VTVGIRSPLSRKSGSQGLPVAKRYRTRCSKATDKITADSLDLRWTR
jgi:hypothetical protein